MSGGQWLRRQSEEHKCPKPTRAEFGRYDVQRGDQWQCDTCRKIYTVTGLDRGHQRDPIYPPMIQWDAGFTPEYTGIYAPGTK